MNIKIDIYLIVSIILLTFFRQVEEFLIFYIFIILHEFAHIIVAKILGIKAYEIMFLPFGVNAKIDYCNHKIKEIIIASAGPIFSLIIALVCKEYFVQNLFIFIVNIIPIYPLDGGRILKNILGAKIYNAIVKAIIILLLIINIILIIFLKYYNFVFVSMYIIQIAEEEIKKEKIKREIASLLNLEN